MYQFSPFIYVYICIYVYGAAGLFRSGSRKHFIHCIYCCLLNCLIWIPTITHPYNLFAEARSFTLCVLNLVECVLVVLPCSVSCTLMLASRDLVISFRLARILCRRGYVFPVAPNRQIMCFLLCVKAPWKLRCLFTHFKSFLFGCVRACVCVLCMFVCVCVGYRTS